MKVKADTSRICASVKKTVTAAWPSPTEVTSAIAKEFHSCILWHSNLQRQASTDRAKVYLRAPRAKCKDLQSVCKQAVGCKEWWLKKVSFYKSIGNMPAPRLLPATDTTQRSQMKKKKKNTLPLTETSSDTTVSAVPASKSTGGSRHPD